MGLIQRRARPLTRDAASLRDDRLFIVACDDTYAPKQYFDFFRFPRIQIHVVPTLDGTCSATDVLKRLLQFEHEDYDELWLLLDTDHYTQGSHLREFRSAIQKAKQKGVKIALSKPCFELWLLLHHQEEPSVALLTNARMVEKALRGKLGQYNKALLKREDYPPAAVRDACWRAERLDKTIASGEIPNKNTSRVYLLWKAIAAKALPSQLPPELRDLIPLEVRRP